MNSLNVNAKDSVVQEITINATAKRVFEAIIHPEARLKWWWNGGGRFRLTHMESDLRVGGQWTMRGVGHDERPLSVSGEYHEIEPPHLLVFSWLPDWQDDGGETLVRWELEEHGGTTTVRLTHSGFASESTKNRYRGWHHVLGGLQAFFE